MGVEVGWVFLAQFLQLFLWVRIKAGLWQSNLIFSLIGSKIMGFKLLLVLKFLVVDQFIQHLFELIFIEFFVLF